MSDIHDELYEVLAHPRRRQLLFRLLDEEPLTDSPIYRDTPPDADGAAESNRIEHEHVHLPKLDDYGFVDWSPGISTVEKGPRFDEIEPVLELLADHHGKVATSQ